MRIRGTAPLWMQNFHVDFCHVLSRTGRGGAFCEGAIEAERKHKEEEEQVLERAQCEGGEREAAILRLRKNTLAVGNEPENGFSV